MELHPVFWSYKELQRVTRVTELHLFSPKNPKKKIFFMKMAKTTALVKNRITGQIYQWEGENDFTNLSTGVSGNIPQKLASEAFVLPVELNLIANKYPEVLGLIKTLQLKLD